MKIVLVLILVLSVLEVFANEIQVKEILPDGELERSFVLNTNLPQKVVIDCQSFIQGLRIGEYESALTYMLNPEDCEGLVIRVKSSLNNSKNHCIQVEEDIQSDYTCK